MSVDARHSFSIGPNLAALLDAGRVRGPNRSDRLDRLAARYSAMVGSLIPQRWTAADWAALAAAAEPLTIDRPDDVLVLAVRLRQSSENRVGSDPVSMAYRFENLHHHEQLACLDVAERLLAAGARDPETVQAWFVEHGVPIA